MRNKENKYEHTRFIMPILLAILVCAVFIMANRPNEKRNTVNAEEINKTEFVNIDSDVEFKKGIITCIYDKDYVCWQADVYFPELNETYPVVLPDSVLDDIYVGWKGYFSFRRYVRTPDWVGFNFNINFYNTKMNSLS